MLNQIFFKMKHIKLLLLVLYPAILFSQVSDIDYKQHELNENIIVITYNLNKIDKYNYYDVKVIGTEDGKLLTIKSLTGDVGEKIQVGLNKSIEWNVLNDVNELLGIFDPNVVAIPNPHNADPDPIITPPVQEMVSTTPYWIGLGGSVLIGGGLMVVGIMNLSDANDMWDKYEYYSDPYDDFWSNLRTERDDYKDDLDSKYTTGVILTSAGAVVVAAGGYFFINKIIKANKKNKMAFNITPVYSPGHSSPVFAKNKLSGAMVSFNFKF